MNQRNPIEKAYTAGSSKLYICFGGLAAGIAMPPFEFYNAARIITENKIFIRDLDRCWYQNGLPGISRDINTTADFLRQEIQNVRPEEVFLVGNSMGGYAAILFASLLQRGNVIAFAPQTFISPILKLIHRDKRWSREILNTYKLSLFKPKAWNLRPLVTRKSREQRISVFVSRDDRLDLAHARHLLGIPGVQVHEIDGGGHEIVVVLRDEGKLPAILAGSYT